MGPTEEAFVKKEEVPPSDEPLPSGPPTMREESSWVANR